MPKIFEPKLYTEEELELLEEKELHFPFSTKYMKYDPIKRQYIPTEELLLKYGIKMSRYVSSPNEVNNELEYISDQVYTYINKNSGSNIETLKCIVAKGIRKGMSAYRFRLAFQEILKNQAIFYLNNGDPSKLTGVDFEQKNGLSKDMLLHEDRQIAPNVKIALMDLGLTWAGSYDNWIGHLVISEDW